MESAAGAQTYQGVSALVWLVCLGTKIGLDTMVCQLDTSWVPGPSWAPAGTSWYQLVPAGTSWYQLLQLVPAGTWYQQVPAGSQLVGSLYQLAPVGTSWYQLVPAGTWRVSI